MTSHRLSPQALKRRLQLERKGDPFLEYTDVEGNVLFFELPADGRVTIGRDESSDLRIEGDDEVSRVHAEFETKGATCFISDDGLSRNGTWLSGTRISGRQRLSEGDTIRVGRSFMVFRAPAEAGDQTVASSDDLRATPLTETQRRVLIALCRPFREGSEFAVPATNKEVAAEVFLSTQAVKAHLRSLFERFGVADLPQNQKRLKLVENALRSGAVTPSQLRDDPAPTGRPSTEA